MCVHARTRVHVRSTRCRQFKVTDTVGAPRLQVWACVHAVAIAISLLFSCLHTLAQKKNICNMHKDRESVYPKTAWNVLLTDKPSYWLAHCTQAAFSLVSFAVSYIFTEQKGDKLSTQSNWDKVEPS